MGRYIRILINGEDIPDGLRVAFELRKPATSEHVTSKIKIWNAEYEVYSQIVTDSIIEVYAGENNIEYGLIFSGVVDKLLLNNRDRSGRYVTIILSDHAHSRSQLQKISNRSYQGSVNTRLVFDDFLKDFGMMSHSLDAISTSHKITDFVFSGRTLDGLTAVANYANCVWYDSNGQIRVRSRDLTTQPDVAYLYVISTLDAYLTNEGAQVAVRLEHSVKRGQRINVESAEVSGFWTVSSLEHEADNWYGAFETRMVLRK